MIDRQRRPRVPAQEADPCRLALPLRLPVDCADSVAEDADTVRQQVAAFESNACDELILFPCSSDPEQVTLLAEAADL